ncbi:glyoxalase [Sorangium cellulosum]|uniref:Glyoxalase n=1 Tax=Sorangium cellulosum TaxID=56 RepID=A0A4V0NEP6_SORCE|nr:VOC family protein [Sorangium cellulosum]AUX26902.1 glyoxalase [Sorangium cellulosum]
MLTNLTPNLMVDDLHSAIAFYCDVLGFELVKTTPERGEKEFAILMSGDVEWMLQTRASWAKECPTIAKLPLGGSVVCYADVDDVRALRRRVEGKVEVIKDLFETTYGTIEFFIRDPNGYILGFCEHSAH